MRKVVRRCLTSAGLALGMLVEACAPGGTPGKPAVPPADLKAAARTMYDAYSEAIATPRREAIAGFYHPEGAVRIIDGVTRRLTRAALDSSYRGPWAPPAYFAWDSLAFDSIAPGQVVVSGAFKWMSAGQRDTMPWTYLSVLHATDSGLAIVFEQEMPRQVR